MNRESRQEIILIKRMLAWLAKYFPRTLDNRRGQVRNYLVENSLAQRALQFVYSFIIDFIKQAVSLLPRVE